MVLKLSYLVADIITRSAMTQFKIFIKADKTGVITEVTA
jgi:hypothetical protein